LCILYLRTGRGTAKKKPEEIPEQQLGNTGIAQTLRREGLRDDNSCGCGGGCGRAGNKTQFANCRKLSEPREQQSGGEPETNTWERLREHFTTSRLRQENRPGEGTCRKTCDSIFTTGDLAEPGNRVEGEGLSKHLLNESGTKKLEDVH
jgi:hypothetical protein